MNKKFKRLMDSKKRGVASLLLLITSLYSQQNEAALTIHAQQFRHNIGISTVMLYREEDDMPKKCFKQKSGVILDGSSTIVFENIPFGNYAAILFHDENSNGILDHTMFFPAEPIGFSHGWKLTLFSGFPSFNKLRFQFSAQSREVTIAFEQ